MKNRTFIILGVIALLTLSIYGSLIASRVFHSQVTASSVGNDVTLEPAPDFELKSLDGRTVKLSDFHGKVVVLNFWATWCAPCRASMPRVQKVWQEYKPNGVELYSVDTDDPSPDRESQVSEFLMQNRLTFPVVLDDGTAEHAFAVASLPTMLLLDRSGHVVWSHVGAFTAPRERDLRAALDRALSP